MKISARCQSTRMANNSPGQNEIVLAGGLRKLGQGGPVQVWPGPPSCKTWAAGKRLVYSICRNSRFRVFEQFRSLPKRKTTEGSKTSVVFSPFSPQKSAVFQGLEGKKGMYHLGGAKSPKMVYCVFSKIRTFWADLFLWTPGVPNVHNPLRRPRREARCIETGKADG